MQFVKQYWLSLVSAVVVLGALGWAYVGLGSTTVRDEMTQRAGVANQIKSIEPRNEEMIKAEKAKAERFVSEYNEVLQVAEERNKRPPLMEGAFPRPAQQYIPTEFKERYIAALRELTTRLEGGDQAGENEKRDAKEEIDEILLRKKAEQDDGATAAPADPGQFNPRNRNQPRGSSGNSPGSNDNSDPLMQPEARANIQKARSIRCYVALDPSRSTYHVTPIVDSQSAPLPDQMWWAQLTLWIQQDIINAIAKVNDAVAKELPDGTATVENMPVKRIESIYVYGYWGPNGMVFDIPRMAGSALPTSPPPSFTGKASDDKFDVVRFAMILTIDQRELLAVIDAICRENFYQLISADVSPVTIGGGGNPYYYGPAPLWSVTLQFEGYMSRKAYVPLMPDAIRSKLGIQPDAKK